MRSTSDTGIVARALRIFGAIALFFGSAMSPFAGVVHAYSLDGSSPHYAFVHDPSMIKEGKTYYLFSTGVPGVGGGNLQVRTSTNLVQWTYVGTVFSEIPGWIIQQVPGVTSLWAPDISYYRGRYQLYYAASTFGSNQSVIGLATNRTLNPHSKNYRWLDQGLVIRSSSYDDWNAIDPNFVLGSKGTPWLDFGSFWSGIKMIRLNPKTRKPSISPARILSLATRNQPPDALEAPFIAYRKPYYYLFASYGFCCRGVNSTYNIRVGRSSKVTGPYYDRAGTALLSGGGTELLATEGAMIGPGGQSVARVGKTYYLVYHYYDAYLNGEARVQIRRLEWSHGWPTVRGSMVAVPGTP